MTVKAWRIATDTPTYTAEDLAGKGAAATGGRWNSPGERMVYAASSISLAAWETRAHLGKSGVALPFNRYLVCIEIPDDVWRDRVHPPVKLPIGWDAIPEGMVSRSHGSSWLAGLSSAVLVVPSVIIKEELNVLINPAHPHAASIKATKIRQFLFDHRV